MLPDFLRDRHFLTQLDNLTVKQQYVRITVLNWIEEPVAEVTGTIISGNLNLDGRSSMRRSGSLSILADNKENLLSNVEHLFSINKKCKIQLGIKNTVPNYIFTKEKGQIVINYQELYGDIVWFPLGVYVMFNPSVSHSLSGITISMNIKDKMCLLNGDIAGQIHSGVVFSIQGEDWDKDSDVTTNPVLLVNIIRQLVNHWGNEALARIFISQVPNQIKMPLQWTGDGTKYLIVSKDNFGFMNSWEEAHDWAIKHNIGESVRFKTSQQYRTWEAGIISGLKGQTEDGDKVDPGSDKTPSQIIKENIASGFIYPFESGQDVGYKYADYVWPDTESFEHPLQCNPGETVTSVLDKIISIMGNYEYFYDVEGNFIFQEKKNNLNMSNEAYWEKEEFASGQAEAIENGQYGSVVVKNLSLPWDAYDADYRRLTKSVYNFDDNKFITAFNNTLNYNNVKNDFVVWGTRKQTGIACRFHLAIDKRPECKTHMVIEYVDEFGIVRACCYVHMREEGEDLNSDGTPMSQAELSDQQIYNLDYLEKVVADNPTIKKAWYEGRVLHYGRRESTDWREELYYQALQAAKTGIDTDTDINNNYAYYYAELIEEFPKIYDLRPILQSKKDDTTYVEDLFDIVGRDDIYNNTTYNAWRGRDKSLKFYNPQGYVCSHARGWKTEIFQHPQNINYFIDFIDEDSELGEFSVRNIGRRPIIVGNSNNGINCVFQPAIPDVVYYNLEDKESMRSFINGNTYTNAETWYNVPDKKTWESFKTGGLLNSCYEEIKNLLYQYTHYNNTISITALPIYYLQPGNRITIQSNASGIHGDYIIQSISLPLDINSTMNISAAKALQRI